MLESAKMVGFHFLYREVVPFVYFTRFYSFVSQA